MEAATDKSTTSSVIGRRKTGVVEGERRGKSLFRLRSSRGLNSVRLRRIFDIFDKNGDGIITLDELRQALSLLGLEADASELESTIKPHIRPGTLGLDYHDFEALQDSLDTSIFDDDGEKEEEEEERDLTEAFKVFDEDGDGYISAHELQAVLDKLGLPEAREMDRVRLMIHNVDLNRDGLVDFFEFKDMMRLTLLVHSS